MKKVIIINEIDLHASLIKCGLEKFITSGQDELIKNLSSGPDIRIEDFSIDWDDLFQG